jgi:hypothetical protein
MNTEKKFELTLVRIAYFVIASIPQIIFMQLLTEPPFSQELGVRLVFMLTITSCLACLVGQGLIIAILNKYEQGSEKYGINLLLLMLCAMLNFLFGGIVMIFHDEPGYIFWGIAGFSLCNSAPLMVDFVKKRKATDVLDADLV